MWKALANRWLRNRESKECPQGDAIRNGSNSPKVHTVTNLYNKMASI